MKLPSRLVLTVAALAHLAMLAGWRWPLPLVPFFFDATVLSGGRGLDFYSVYQAGYNARHGDDIYEGDPAKIEMVAPYFTPYRYLPVVAYTVGAALSLFSPLTAYKLWVVILELNLLLCVLITYRRVQDPDRFARLAAMWLCFTPFYLELLMGQFSLVQGTLILGMMVSTQFDSLWIASVLWKINTIILVPVALRLRRFRALMGMVLMVAVTTVPYFLIFPAHLRDFLANNFGNSVTGHELGNLGFRQLVFELLAVLEASPDLQRFAQLTLVSFTLGAALALTFLLPASFFQAPTRPWCLRPPVSDIRLLTRPWRLRPRSCDLLSLWLTAFFLVSPQVWEHHFVMLLPVLVTAFHERPSRFIGLIWLLLALPTPFGFIGLHTVIAGNHDLRAFPLEPAWKPLLEHGSKAVPTLLLFSYFAVRLTQRIRLARSD